MEILTSSPNDDHFRQPEAIPYPIYAISIILLVKKVKLTPLYYLSLSYVILSTDLQANYLLYLGWIVALKIYDYFRYQHSHFFYVVVSRTEFNGTENNETARYGEVSNISTNIFLHIEMCDV